MRKVDLHCYPGTQAWIDSYGPFAKALGAYWKKDWGAKSENEVIAEFQAAGVEAVLVAFDIESVTGAPPCTNDYVAAMRDRHQGTVLQAWAAVDPLKIDVALEEIRHAIEDLGMLGFHFHPVMGRYSVDEERLRPLFALIDRRPGIRVSQPDDHRRASRLALGRGDDGRGTAQGKCLLGALWMGTENSFAWWSGAPTFSSIPGMSWQWATR